MAQRQRPLSPHLQIYKPQLTSMMSIGHRISGFILFMGSLIIGGWFILLGYGNNGIYNVFADLFRTGAGQIFMVLWSLVFFYHFCNGIRHLAWDMGYGLELGTVYKSGYTTLTMAVVLTVLLWGAVL